MDIPMNPPTVDPWSVPAPGVTPYPGSGVGDFFPGGDLARGGGGAGGGGGIPLADAFKKLFGGGDDALKRILGLLAGGGAALMGGETEAEQGLGRVIGQAEQRVDAASPMFSALMAMANASMPRYAREGMGQFQLPGAQAPAGSAPPASRLPESLLRDGGTATDRGVGWSAPLGTTRDRTPPEY